MPRHGTRHETEKASSRPPVGRLVKDRKGRSWHGRKDNSAALAQQPTPPAFPRWPRHALLETPRTERRVSGSEDGMGRADGEKIGKRRCSLDGSACGDTVPKGWLACRGRRHGAIGHTDDGLDRPLVARRCLTRAVLESPWTEHVPCPKPLRPAGFAGIAPFLVFLCAQCRAKPESSSRSPDRSRGHAWTNYNSYHCNKARSIEGIPWGVQSMSSLR